MRFAAVLSVIALILVVLVYADPPAEGVSDAVQSSSTIQLKPDMFSIIMVALAFCAWNIINAGAISGFYPSYLADVHHLGTQMAGTVSSTFLAIQYSFQLLWNIFYIFYSS